MQGKKAFRVHVLSGFLCLLALLVSACGTTASNSTGQAAASADKQIFRYADPGIDDFGTVDPALVQDAGDNTAIQAIFTGLVGDDDKGNVIDEMAASHKISADGLTYTFTLKPNLKFSDGTPITSHDVAYSINRTLLPDTKSPVTSYLGLIKGADQIQDPKSGVTTLIGTSLLTPDDKTISIVLSHPGAYFLQQLTYPTAFVVEKKLIDQYGATWTDHLNQGGGDGPFKVASYSHSKGMDLVPNDNYYNAKPQIKKFQILFSGDTDTTYKAYLSHQYDYAAVPPANVPDAQKKKDFHAYQILVIRYITMNYNVKPFDNIKVRQAFALALKKDLINSTVLRNAHQATNHLIPIGMYGASPTVTGPAGVSTTNGDQAKAQQLLKEGLQEEGMSALPTITFNTYSGNPTITAVTDAIESQWTTVLGATFKTETTSFPTLSKLTSDNIGKTNLQMWISGWSADYPDPEDWLSIFFGKGQSYNQQNYGQNNSPTAADQVAVQQILDKADITNDPAARTKLYNQAEQKIINDVGWIPLYQQQGHTMVNTKVQGFVLNAAQNIPPDDWANIYVAQ